MRWFWVMVTLGALVLLMLGITVVSVVVIMVRWPAGTLSEEETFQPIHAVAFFPDGRRFASLNNAGPVRVWDVKTGKELKRFTPGSRNPSDAGIVAMAVSRDGRYLAGASNRERLEKYGVDVWDVATGQEVGSFIGHSQMVKSVAFTPDGRRILTASGDQTIRVWDTGTGRAIRCLRGHGADVNALAVTPDGRYALSGAGDYWGGKLHDPTIRMWDLDSGLMVRVFEGHSGSIDDISISADGKLLASVSWDGSLRIWNLTNGEQMQSWPAPRGRFNAVSFSPNGKAVLTGSSYSQEGAVQLWDVATGKELREFGPNTITHDVAFSPDGKTLVSAREITVPAPPPPPIYLMYADEFQAGIAVVSDLESAKELLRVGVVPRQPAGQESK